MNPLFKTAYSKHAFTNWTIDHFPEGYQEMDYVEPYVAAGSVMFNKEPSQFEVINDLEAEVVQIYHALRDEPTMFIGRLKRVKYCESTFLKAAKKVQDTEKWDDYMDQAVAEFKLRKMSRGGDKKNFTPRNGHPEYLERAAAVWKQDIAGLSEVAARLQSCHIMQKPTVDLLKAFNSKGTFVFASPPPLPKNDMVDESEFVEHTKTADLLRQYDGKVIVSHTSSPLYRRLYRDWRYARKKSSNQKIEMLWMNY